MEEILKRLGDIENRILAVEKRIEKIEALSIATSQKVVDIQTQSRGATPASTISGSKVELPVAQAILKSKSSRAESYIGRWVAGIIGIIAIVLGASYFLKWAFENNFIGYTGRVILGLMGGLGFVILGEFMRPRQKTYSYILSSAGLGLLYLSTYATYGYYGLIGPSTSFIFMTTVTIFGASLALRADAVELALLTTAVGFLVPYLFGDADLTDLGYFIYSLSLNIGVLGIGYFKKWYPLAILGLGGTAMHFGTWHATLYANDKLLLAIFALTSFYLIYLIVGNLMSYTKTNEGTKNDLGELFVLTINPIWFFFWLYNLLHYESARNDTVLAFTAVLLSLVYIILARAGQKLKNLEDNMPKFLGAIAAVFLTIAIPLQFSANAITIAWATEAVIIALLGITTKNDGMKKVALIILAITIWRLFAFDSEIGEIELLTFIPIINLRFFTYLIVMLATSTIAYMFGHMMKNDRAADPKIVAILWTMVNILTLISGTTEINTFYQSKILAIEKNIQSQVRQLPLPASEETTKPPYYDQNYYEALNKSPELKSARNQSNATVSIFWTIYSIILISLGICWKVAFLRWSAIILFAVTIFKVFLVDLYDLATPYKVLSLTILGVILLLVSYLYFKHQAKIEQK
ncbi:MAG: DUF2339 domain-containing protein [Candidatus Vogelbacteria bacterium]|nr:DUF2339 domain-containing protein [Candidatus Vogelbacteria bacterium]